MIAFGHDTIAEMEDQPRLRRERPVRPGCKGCCDAPAYQPAAYRHNASRVPGVADNPRRGALILWTVLFVAWAVAGFVGAGLAERWITSAIFAWFGVLGVSGVVVVLDVAMEPNERSE